MLELFEKYISDNDLFTPECKILLGVSGGVDSMVMLNLFIRKNFNIGIAHCNFQLRGKESDDDQKFVEGIAKHESVAFHTKEFNTKDYARKNNLSIQMAARKLRYKWFNEIRLKYGYKYIAIGHNLDDTVETFFINLLRGTGIRGLTGIKPKFKNIIRPLLFASRKEILQYTKDCKITFREDSSNIETKYIRNKIRHDIIPLFNRINTDFNITMNETIKRLKDSETILNKSIEKIKSEIFIKESSNNYLIDIEKLKDIKPIDSVLFEIVKDYGFNYQTVENIISSLYDIPGKKFYSKTHRIIKDRTALIITAIRKSESNITRINEDIAEIECPLPLIIARFNRPENYCIPQDRKYALLDADKISYPIELRKWKKGDRFMPLGMKSFKKLSDFFIDYKLSIPEKENVWLLTSGEDIIWIVDYRIDERFKINNTTRNILLIEYKKSI